MDAQEKGNIVVFEKYASAMDTNLAKTKLDAYGIPCFLANENISGLCPLPFLKGFEVTLHIFETDRVAAREVLSGNEE
jgi:hypothetical protein